MHQPQYLHVDDESLCLWKFVCIYLCNIWLRCILIELKRRWTQVASILMFKGTLVRIAWNEYVLHVPEHPSRKFIDELIFLFNHLFNWLWLNEFCNFSLTVFFCFDWWYHLLSCTENVWKTAYASLPVPTQSYALILNIFLLRRCSSFVANPVSNIMLLRYAMPFLY